MTPAGAPGTAANGYRAESRDGASVEGSVTALMDAIPTSEDHRYIAQIVDRTAYSAGTEGPAATATRLLGDPRVAGWRDAAERVTAVLALHQPRRLAVDSDIVMCTCGGGDYEGCPSGRAARGEP